MRRGILLALMIPLLLCSCAGEREEERLNILRDAIEGGTVTFSADITMQWEDTFFACSEEVVWKDGELSASLTAPDTLVGISYHTGEENTLEYDGVILSLGKGIGSPSPAEAAPRMMAALTEGRLLYTGSDRDTWFAVLAEDTGDSVNITFSRENDTPLYCEIIRDGAVVLSLRVTDWKTV